MRKKTTGSNKKLQHNNSPYIIGIIFVLLVIVLFQLKMNQDNRIRAQQALVNCTVSATDLTVDSEEQKAFDDINTYRQQNGLPQLKMSSNLTRAAAWMANDMAAHNSVDHTDSSRRSYLTRIQNCGYTDINVQENLASNEATAAAAVTWWENSPVHNANLLSQAVTVAGIAMKNGFWALDFGSVDDSNNPSVSPQPSVAISNSPTVVPSGVPSPACLGSCPTMSPSITTPGCVQRPTCLDAVPRCLIAEPAGGWCPNASTSPSVQPQPSTETPSTAPTAIQSSTAPLPGDNSGNSNGGLIQLFLQLIITIINFFLSLLKHH